MNILIDILLKVAYWVRNLASFGILSMTLLVAGCRHITYQVSNPVEVMISNENDIAFKLIDSRKRFRNASEIYVHIPAQVMEDYIVTDMRMVEISVRSSPCKSLKAAMYNVPYRVDRLPPDLDLSRRWEEMTAEEAIQNNLWFMGCNQDFKYYSTFQEIDFNVIVPYNINGTTYYIYIYPRTAKLSWFLF